MGAKGWEVWTLAWDPVPIVHRMFEIHKDWRDFHGPGSEDAGAHYRWLLGQKVPIYMPQVETDIPMSVRYPIEAVGDLVGRTAKGHVYLESSIGFMIALAMLEFKQSHRADGMRLGIWGVDMAADTEYTYQKANTEYLIGMARGMGIKVFIPSVSALCTHANGAPYGDWLSPERIAEQKAKAA